MISPDDLSFLDRAAELSRRGIEPFGALVVRNGRVLGEGWNERTPDFDPTAHAEINAIRRACAAIGNATLEGSTLYASCEPCPMCLGAIHWACIERLIFANNRDDAAAIGFDDIWLYNEMPKPIGERLIPTLHVPRASASAVFTEWRARR